RDLKVCVEQRYLHTIHFVLVLANYSKARAHRSFEIAASPVPFERWIEHWSKPVQNDRLLRLLENAAIHECIILCCLCYAGQGAAGHQDDSASGSLHCCTLLFVSMQHIVQCEALRQIQMVCARSAGNGAAYCFRSTRAPRDQLLCCRPIQSHAALCR